MQFVERTSKEIQLHHIVCIINRVKGLDLRFSVKDNQLTTKVHEGSKMIAIFDKTSGNSNGDVNGDGNIDISDVVSLVNMILGQ